MDSVAGQIGVPLSAAALSAIFPRHGAPAVQAGLSGLGAVQDFRLQGARIQDVKSQAKIRDEEAAQRKAGLAALPWNQSDRLGDVVSQVQASPSAGGHDTGADPALKTKALEMGHTPSPTQTGPEAIASAAQPFQLDPQQRQTLQGMQFAEGPDKAMAAYQEMEKRSRRPTNAAMQGLDTSHLPPGLKMSGKTQEDVDYSFSGPDAPKPPSNVYEDLQQGPMHGESPLAIEAAAKEASQTSPPGYKDYIKANPTGNYFDYKHKLASAERIEGPVDWQLMDGPNGQYMVNPRTQEIRPLNAPGGVPTQSGDIESGGGSRLGGQVTTAPAEPFRLSKPGTVSQDDIDRLAEGVDNYTIDPTGQGMGRSGVWPRVLAKLTGKGVNVAARRMEWEAVKKFNASANNETQVKMQQDLKFTRAAVDKAVELYDRLEQVMPKTQFRTLDRAAMNAMKQIPGEIGVAAQNLDTQINDSIASVAKVYMAGNSPTDKGLSIASENLKGEWNPQTFHGAADLLRTNLQARASAMSSATPMGMGAGSAYAPQQQQAPAPTGGNQSAGASFKYTATGPNGERIGSNDGKSWTPIK